MKLTIAVIGWGSLIWDPRTLSLRGPCRPDGPLLPVEYLRVSGKTKPPRRLTLVLADDGATPWIRKVRTLWAISTFEDLDDARHNLAVRERCDLPDIGFVVSPAIQPTAGPQLNAIPDPAKSRALLEIQRFLKANSLDAAIWADLSWSPELAQDPVTRQPHPLSADDAIRWLEQLPVSAATDSDRIASENYIRRTPLQVWTAVREQAESRFGWSPIVTPPPIQAGDDPRFKEWSEARTTIGRFDTILVDLRKVGFSIITGLLTAGTVFGFLGVGVQATSPAPPIEARVAAFITLMVLVALLFSVDTYFEVLLSGAVERALDIEAQTDPPVRLTKYISWNIHHV